MTTDVLLPDPATGAAARHAALVQDVVVARVARSAGDQAPGWLLTDCARRARALGGDDSDDADDLTRRADTALAEFESVHAASTGGPRLPLSTLDPSEARLLVAAGLIEDDVRFGALFAALQAPLPARRPCVGLLGWLLAGPRGAGEEAADLHERLQGLAARGLLSVDNADDPRSEWVPRLPVAVWDVIHRGRIVAASLPETLTHRSPGTFPSLAAVVLGAPERLVADRLPELVRHGAVSALVLRGLDGSGRVTLLGAVATALGQGLLLHDGEPGDAGWTLLAPLAELGDAFPVAALNPGPGTTVRLPALPGLHRPLGLAVGPGGGLTGPVLDRAVGLTLTPCGSAARRALWTSSARITAEDADLIADTFLLTPGTVRRTALLASTAAASAGRPTVTPDDVRSATGALQRQSLETLATRLEPLTRSGPPVLGAVAADELAGLVTRCRYRERLWESPGALAGTVNRGVRALFTGPSGTGKTLTARYLAARLQVDVYRVDLAAVVNKYIGETERNLEQVLIRAEELDVLLLLDEGDALLTRRTDVGNANDRYANLETNYLLQRLETFDGIVVVTTNAGNRIDPAFLRRIDVTIDFAPPDADQRWQLWLAHLPDEHTVDPGRLQDVARRCVLTGGQIRNAALHARLLALDRGDAVDDGDLDAALRREYRRSGASFPLGATRPPGRPGSDR